ncbi:cysteine hydrolase family protein [Aspergillus affinis]|uniref:cysteine hydrolase family protein n=1 Tax=Aspergillus affinis TaxID=1070780 RepID=UPI0022FDD683|nr:uncharacterized protein KD926_010557 [Aspergillus affinis]KAI9038614.1 hypothetical protein KD926_010557 [Aspergillus affinis]
MSCISQSFREIVGIPRSSASPQDSTLIIIDAQNEYATGALKTENVTETRKSIATLLERYRQAGNGKNIVHVVHEVPEGAPVFTPNTPLAQEFEELTPKAGEKVVTKSFPSSFAKTDLHAYLQGLGDVGKKVVLVGYMAHVCVSTTTRAAAELGYDVLVVRNAVGDRDIPGVKAENLVSVVLSNLCNLKPQGLLDHIYLEDLLFERPSSKYTALLLFAPLRRQTMRLGMALKYTNAVQRCLYLHNCVTMKETKEILAPELDALTTFDDHLILFEAEMSLQYDEFFREGLDNNNAAPRAGIVLRSSAQWRTWFSQIKASAQSNDIWEYINPDDTIPTPMPKKPRKPVPSDAQDGAITVRELTEEADNWLQRQLKHHDRDMLEYSVVKRSLD